MSDDETETPDSILVQRALAGSGFAFTCLFHRYYDRVRNFAYRMVLDYQASDDVAQETFIRAAGKLATIRESQAFTAWIFRIASNVAKDHIRSRSSHERKLQQAFLLAVPDSETHPEDESAANVVRALQALPVRQREAVALVLFEDCSHAEAAARVGCAVSTISWRMSLAKQTLRKHLSP